MSTIPLCLYPYVGTLTRALVNVQFVDVLVPTLVKGHDYSAAPMISVVVGNRHVCALDIYGRMYTWGNAVEIVYQISDDGGPLVEHEHTGALGHTNMPLPLVLAPMLLDVFQGGLQVGCFKSLSLSHVMAFSMGTHKRLATKEGPASVSPVYCIPLSLVQKILEETVLSPRLSSHAGHGLKKLFGCMELAAL